MTTPTPSQGFLPTSNAGFANLSSDGFANLSSDGFLPEVSRPSLLESKQQQVTAISDAKKQALDPSVIPYENLSVTDGDTLRNRLNGEKYRLTDTSPGTSFDTFETPHGTHKTDAARMLKDKQAIALDIGLPTSYIPDLAVFNRGRAGEEALKRTLQEAGNVQISPTGKVDRDRLISELIDPTTGQSLLPAMNTPELNAGYHSKYNIVKEGQDLIQKAAEREKATEFSVSDDTRDSFLGGAANLVATGATAFGDSVGRVLKAPALIAQSLRETGITQKQRDLFTSLNTKMAEAEKAGVDYAPTAEEQTILESPLQAFKRETLKPVMDGERNIAASDFLNLVSVAQPSMSVFQKLSASDRVQQNYTDPLNVVRDTAAGLVNTAGTDELHRQVAGLANDAVMPSIAEGYAKFKDGKEVDGALQIADAVTNWAAGTGRIAANNKQAAIEEVARVIPDMLTAGVSVGALFVGLGTETEAEAVKGYVKEHGVHPEGMALFRLRVDAWASAVIDSITDKAVATKPGVFKAIGGETGDETIQNVLEQDAVKQDLSKIEVGEALAAGSLGAIAGGGASVAMHPVEAIKEAGSAIASTGKTGLDLASKLVPASVSQAFSTGTQAVSNAVDSTTQAVTDAIGEVNSSTSTPTADPLKQSAQTQDSVEALKTLLRPENIISATSTPEDHKAFVIEASRHNAELAKEMFAITDPATAPTEENTARAKVLLTEFRKNKDVIDGIKAGNSVADTTDADLSIVATPDHPDTLQAVDRTIRSMRQPDKVSLEQAEAFQAKATLTPEQTSVVSAFIATKKASDTMTEVNKDVIYGKPGFLGMVEHQAILSDALDQENIPAAQSALDSFKAFAASQVNKVDSLNAIVSAISTSNVEQVKELVTKFAKDFPTAQPLKLGKYEILKVLDKANGLELAKTSEALGKFQGLANNVGKEANMLTTAVAEAELHFKLGTTTEAKAVPVAQESGALVPVGTEASVDTLPAGVELGSNANGSFYRVLTEGVGEARVSESVSGVYSKTIHESGKTSDSVVNMEGDLVSASDIRLPISLNGEQVSQGPEITTWVGSKVARELVAKLIATTHSLKTPESSIEPIHDLIRKIVTAEIPFNQLKESADSLITPAPVVTSTSNLLTPVGNTTTVPDTTDYTVSTLDRGDFTVKVKHLDGGGIVIFDGSNAIEHNKDFAVGKTVQNLLEYSYEPLGYTGSTSISKPTSNTGLLTEDKINQLDTGNTNLTSSLDSSTTQASGTGQVSSEFPNAPSEYKIDNIDEMIATNGGVPAVSQFTDKGYQSVNFKDFHLSIDNENKSAEVAKVELGTEERGKGHGINAYKALGDALAERGITLTSSEAQYADGKNMWHKLVKQGHAVKKGIYFEYVPTKPAIESKPAPAVDPIVNEVTIDPVINNTAVDQVTTDTSGNAEEESVTDPVTIVADATAQEVDKHNKDLRHKPESGVSLRSNLIPESNNILYRPDRAYRAIGTGGYNDFLQNKVIRSKLDGKTTYENDYYSKGSTENRYTKGDRGKYVVEAVTDNQWNNADNGYLSAPKNITENSKIRIHERQADGSYKTVFDNINDQAYLNRDATAQATENVAQPQELADATPRPEPISKEAFNKLSEEEQKRHLGSRHSEGYGGQFLPGDKVISEEHGPGVIKTGGGRSKWVVNFDSGIEANVPDNTLDVKEVPSPVVEVVTDTGTTEVVTPLEQIKALAASKNYPGRPKLIAAVNVILRDNSLEQYDESQVAFIIKKLEDMPNKPTSLGEYLLDSLRKFTGGKKLSDYYSAKILDKASKHSALLTTPNFFSALKDAGVKDALGLTPEQLNGLDALTGFVNKFADTFKASTFTPLMVDDAEVLNRNPALYFMKEGGRDFDENFVSTLATVGYSWVANNANSLIQHSNEGINSLLGRDSKHKVTATERKLLSDKQIVKTALIHSLGGEIVSSLGMTFNTKEDGSIESKMVEALGAYAVMTLEHMGVLAKSEVIHKKVFEAMKKGEAVSDADLKLKAEGNNIIYFTGVATTVTPVKGKRYSKTELSTETKLLEVDDEGKVVTPQTYNVQGIVDDNRMSKGLLSELFDYKQQLALPLLVAPTLKDVPKFVKRGIKRIPKRVRKALHKYNSNAFTVNMGNHTVLDFLEPEQQLRIFKYNENLEGVHDVDIKSVQGTNRTTKNELEAYHHLVDHLKLQPGGMSTAMYFMSTVVSNGRANMEGLINPQASKFFRHMIGMASWESTIDSPAKLKLFKIAVAEALGSKVDRQGDETSLEAFDRLRNQPEIRDGVATIKYLKSGIEMSAEEKLDAQEAILAAIEKGGSEIYTLEALTALSTYSETEPFTTRMTKEVDGITNGVIIGLIQLMGQRPKAMLKFLEAGGVSQDSNFVYGDFISKVGSFDNYQRVASTLVEYMDAFRNEMATLTEGARLTKKFTTKGGNTSTLDGIDFFIGNLGDADNLTSEARDLAKNPVLITNYGAAFKKIIQSLGEGTIENFYKKLTEARHDQEALNEIAKQLNKILKHKPEDAHKFLEDSTLPYFAKPLNEALKFTLSNEEIATIHLHVANSIGAAMQHALETHFGTFIAKRKELNNAMTLVHAAFIIKYDAAYKAARDLKGSNLSREERDALVKTLEPSMASFDHAMSDGEMDTELFVAKNESKTNLTNDYRVQVNSKKNLPHGTKSTTARGQVSYYGFPGVRSVILAIHSSDGAVQYKLMETSAVLNVHDADVSGIDGAMAMAQRQNLAFKEVMEDYSMRASIQKTLLRAMKALTEDEWYVLNEQLQITDDKAEGFLGHDFVFSTGFGENKIVYAKYESVHAFVDEFTDTTKRDLAAKKALLASLKSWGQYNLNHGAYVESAESEALFAAIDELRDSLERDDAESNTAIQAELAHMENAERNRINDQIKSSATEDIDIANFVADFKPITVSASTVNSIFDELGKIDKVTDFPSHTEHLRTVLNESIRQVLNPMELLVRKLGKANSGVLAKGKIYLSMGSTGRLHTTDQSAQEVYAHELVHSVTEAALSSNYWLRKQARSLYEKVQDQITPESFLDYDAQGNVIVPAGSTLDQTIAKAKAVHDHIFDNNDITKTSYKNPITNEIVPLQYSNGLLEFVAMGTTNAKFIRILAGINTNKSKRDVLTYADRVYNLFVGAINSVTSLINKTKDPAANVALMILMHKLANANQVKSNIIMRKFEENGHLEDIVNSKLYKVLAYSALKSGEILKARKNKTLSAVGEMIGLSQDTSFEAYKKVAGKLARKHGITHENILSKLVTEAEGITAISAKYMHKLAKSNMLIDQLRRLKAQSVTNQILGSFIAGTPSKSEGIAITKVMLKTDMSSLIDSGYTWDKMFGLLKSRSKRLAEIATVEKLLQAAAPTNFDYYKTQAVTLGYMMVNGQPLKWGTKINAVNIAHLGGTGKKVEGDLKVIEGYLDILASLHAIKYSDAGHVTDFVTVAEREFAKDKDNNGVMLSYLVHKDLKARALEQSFEGQKEQMFKGYTKEIYNPRVSIEVAPDNAYLDLKADKLGNVISTEAKMKAKGYIKVRGAMSKDPTDLNKEPMSLYVNKDGDTATFNKMGVSLTSDRRKGHDLGAGYSSMGVINPALIGSWDTTLATKEGQKILARADYADLSKVDSNNLLVPVENAQHEIVGYRYLMHEGTKDDLLEKENDFAKVLGAMEGSIVDKQNSKQINNEYVNLMHDDFVAEYAKNPDLFIKFSPHSQNAKHRELYAMLPNDMRREIKKVWKSDVMYVRANMFDAIFGYRKFTVTEGSKEEDEMNAMHDGVLTNFRIALRDKLRTPTAKKAEIALQEIAKEVKDAIVIKLPDTLYNNVISNNLLLWVKGIGRLSIVKDQAMFLDAARQYHKDVAKLMELERSVRINPKLQNSANVKSKINSLKDHMANNPIAFLMDSGVSQTIIEDVDTDESKYTYKGMIEEKLAPLVSRVPKPLKTLASVAYMTHDTKLYKFLREATQLSDLVARATLHKHNTEKKGMSFVDSINDIKDTFIDYDAPTSKQIQYLNDTNFLMFTKFFIRSQKIIYQTYANAPARALSLLGFEEAFGEMSTINDSNIINTSILGKINFPLALMDDLVVPHTASLLDLTGAGGGSYTPQ